jgi:muramoyltetrapeptide carboxypeptidase
MVRSHAPLRPPALREGARVSLVSPAGPSGSERIEAAIAHCQEMGWEPVLGRFARERRGFLAGSDDERLADLESAIRDPSTQAIWAIRGGYGTMRLLDRLDFGWVRRHPKVFLGFSDNTSLHLGYAKYGVVSFHGVHAGAPLTGFTRNAMQDVLTEREPAGVLRMPAGAEPVVTLREGVTEGRLIGGNLTILAATCGTRFELDARGAIVVIEDVNEPFYRLDRALTQLRLSGVLTGVAGIAFGRFTHDGEQNGNGSAEDGPDSGLSEVLGDRIRSLGVPTACGFPIGHIEDQWCLPLGVNARLDASNGTLEILEPAVA